MHLICTDFLPAFAGKTTAKSRNTRNALMVAEPGDYGVSVYTVLIDTDLNKQRNPKEAGGVLFYSHFFGTEGGV